MTSERKIKANRANARASTGPKTAQGRARAARNALRHGLSLPVCSDPGLSEEIEALACEIAGTDANAETQELARRIAEAQIDLRRVRYARHQLLIRSLLRWNTPDAIPVKHVTSTPEGPQKFAITVKQLLATDRYERRAMLRRNIAIQAFDEMRRDHRGLEMQTWQNEAKIMNFFNVVDPRGAWPLTPPMLSWPRRNSAVTMTLVQTRCSPTL